MWRSCGESANSQILHFRWATILLPPSIIEYVVVHELTHLQEHYHTPEFWWWVERSMPNFEQRREWLARHETDQDLRHKEQWKEVRQPSSGFAKLPSWGGGGDLWSFSAHQCLCGAG